MEWLPAMLLKPDGQQEEWKCFEKDLTKEIYLSCSVNWQNQLYIFGGESQKRQILRLTGHKLEYAGQLSFDHKMGACSVMADQYIFLCFGTTPFFADSNRCRRSTGPLNQFTDIALSTYDHGLTQTSCSESKYKKLFNKLIIYLAVLVAVGDFISKKSEIFVDEKWATIEDPPINGVAITAYATIFHAGYHYYFGGYTASRIRSIIRLEEKSWTWSNYGEMNTARQGHGVILFDDRFLVIGGYYTKKNEVCQFDADKLTCTEFASSLSNYENTPSLFIVDIDSEPCQ